MLYQVDLEKISNMPMGNMAEFDERKIEVYSSMDPALTGNYFGDSDHKPTEFTVVIFEYHHLHPEIFIMYPKSDFFIPLEGGFGNCRGSMCQGGGTDIIAQLVSPEIIDNKHYPTYVTINKHENHLFLQFGFKKGEFNFLHRVALGNMKTYDKFIPLWNEETIENVLSKKYVKFPDHRKIEYSYMTEDLDLILVDYPAHQFSYEGHRFWFGNLGTGMKEGKISNFIRARDGGTTNMDITIDGTIHKFYSPTPFNPDAKATWNGKELTDLNKDQIELLVASLGIQLVQKTEPLVLT